MDEKTEREIADSLKLISRALGIISVISGATANRPLGVKARLLKSIGFDNDTIAELLNSTTGSIGVRLTETKTWRDDLSKPETEAN